MVQKAIFNGDSPKVKDKRQTCSLVNGTHQFQKRGSFTILRYVYLTRWEYDFTVTFLASFGEHLKQMMASGCTH